METNLDLIKHAQSLLNYNFTLKNFQSNALNLILNKKDVFCVASTGSGKSLIYELAPVIIALKNCTDVELINLKDLGCTVIIIQPLKALMEENVTRLREKGLSAVYVGNDEPNLMNRIVKGEFNYIFGSPESLVGEGIYSEIFLPGAFVDSVKLLVVDESHCIKKWGMKGLNAKEEVFRESYGEIGNIRSRLGNTVPCLTLTATSTKKTKSDICRNLGMNDCEYIILDANKPNIRYSVLNVADDFRKNFTWLVDELSKNGVNTTRHLIFCHKTEDMNKLFRYFSLSLGDKQYHIESESNTKDDTSRIFAMYHQKTDKEIQHTIRKSFAHKNGTVRVLFCTIAFGMGMDVKGVNNVIHYGPARDIDDYLQESGRGGRDPNEQSHALLLNPKGSTRGCHISSGMRLYIKDNTRCKRVQLMENLVDDPSSLNVKHDCCSYCSVTCFCKCMCASKSSCDCSEPCMLNTSLAEQKLHLVYSATDLDSSDEEDYDNKLTSTHSEDEIIEPVLWPSSDSSSSDETSEL